MILIIIGASASVVKELIEEKLLQNDMTIDELEIVVIDELYASEPLTNTLKDNIILDFYPMEYLEEMEYFKEKVKCEVKTKDFLFSFLTSTKNKINQEIIINRLAKKILRRVFVDVEMVGNR